jgi:hypothetical protein
LRNPNEIIVEILARAKTHPAADAREDSSAQ